MRKTLFIIFLLTGAAVGMLASLADDWATRIVMSMIGGLFGAAVGGPFANRTRPERGIPLDNPIPGMGTSTADIAANYWRDKGHPPFMKPPSARSDHRGYDPDGQG